MMNGVLFRRYDGSEVANNINADDAKRIARETGPGSYGFDTDSISLDIIVDPNGTVRSYIAYSAN